tara:strand:- start:224 stop:421 length:198 start_codon:yes stop_codon:yes gene_type:complete
MTIEEKEMTNEELLRRAYAWFGTKPPSGHTRALRDDYMTTMKAFSAWIRKDKTDNPDRWENGKPV